jgi:hypothetical protein
LLFLSTLLQFSRIPILSKIETMKYSLLFITLCSSIFLTSCGEKIKESSLPANTSEETSQIIRTDYEEVLDSVSKKIETTQEFRGCMTTSIHMCHENSAMEKASQTRDILYCDELQTEDKKENCRFALTVTEALRKLDPTLCNTLSEPYFISCKKQVYHSSAVRKQDANFCDNLAASTTTITQEERTEIQSCLLAVILSNTGSTQKSCDKLADISLKNSCKTTLQNKK